MVTADLDERLADGLPPTDAQQPLGARVEEQHPAVDVGHHQAVGDSFENRGEPVALG